VLEGKEQRGLRRDGVLEVRRASKRAVTQHNSAYNEFLHKKETALIATFLFFN